MLCKLVFNVCCNLKYIKMLMEQLAQAKSCYFSNQ